MSFKRNKTLLIISFLMVLFVMCYQNLENYQQQRIHLLINDFLLSWQTQ